MKSNTVIGIVGSGFLLLLSGAMMMAQERPGMPTRETGNSQGEDNSRILVGFEYVRDQHIMLDLRHKNRALVGLGSYLVNAVGGCNDCHTAPPYTKDPYAFLGAPKQINNECYLAGGTPFGPPGPDTPVSRDITPFEDGKPAGLTREQFIHVIRTGEDPDEPGHVLEVMPWPVYQEMTDRDLRAIYEYLSAIPAIPVNTCGVPSE
jgi:hypothetical protein